MRRVALAILLCSLSSSWASADDLTYRPLERATRRHMLVAGARGLAVTSVFVGLSAGLGALVMFGCKPGNGSDYSDSDFCALRDTSPAEAAVIGALGSTLLLAPAISGGMMASAGDEHRRGGSSSAAVLAAYGALVTTTGLSYGVYRALDQHDARVTAPVTSLLVLTSLASALGAGFLAYRWSEPRQFSGKESMSAHVAPLLGPGHYGLGVATRF